MIHGGVSHSHDCLVTLHSNQPIATRCLVCIPETVLLGTFLVEDGTISAKFVSLVGGTDPIASRMLTRVVMRPQNPVLFLFFFFSNGERPIFDACSSKQSCSSNLLSAHFGHANSAKTCSYFSFQVVNPVLFPLHLLHEVSAVPCTALRVSELADIRFHFCISWERLGRANAVFPTLSLVERRM